MPTQFAASEYERRMAQIQTAMDRERLELLVITAPENLAYVTGYDCCAYYQFQAAVVVLGEPEPLLLIRNLEASLVEDTAATKRVVTYRLETDDPVQVLAGLLREMGAEQKRIGIEKDSWFLKVAEYERLTLALASSRFADASGLVGKVRLVKSAAEIEAMRRAARLSVIGVETALADLREGVTEAEVTAHMQAAMFAAGSDFLTIPILIGFGRRSRYVHGVHSQKSLARGEHVVIELSGSHWRYNANLMRTYSLGTPSHEVQHAYDVVRSASEAGIATIRPGVRIWEVDRAARKVTTDAGFGPNHLHRTSYGVGLGYPPAWIEPLSAQEADPQVLLPGMTVTCEPTLYFDGFGVRIGDTILVTENGAEVLTDTPRDLRIVR